MYPIMSATKSREISKYNKTRALCMGINYNYTCNELNGCENDAKDLAHYLGECNAVKAENTHILLNGTRAQILDALHVLSVQALEEALDWVMISYSGHGSAQVDTDGDEVDGQDEVICPMDFEQAGCITDDEIHQCLDAFPKQCAVTLLMDCCHSGTIGDLGYTCATFTRQAPDSKHDHSCDSTVLMISGCMDQQVSCDAFDRIEQEFSGALTCALIWTLRYVPGTRSDVFKLIEAMRKRLLQQGFNQLPQLSSSKVLTENTPFIPHSDVVHSIPSPKRR
jgi:metacaspase-1